MQKFLFLTLAALMLLFCDAQAAEKYNYDYFYKNSEAFRDADRELNAIYKKVRASMNSVQKRILLKEQRFWHDNWFNGRIDSESGIENRTSKAIALVRDRVADLEKLQNAKVPGNIMGLTLHFGMTKAQVCKALNITDASMCARLGTNAYRDDPYMFKFLGMETDARFFFLPTIFIDEEIVNIGQKPDFSRFANFLKSNNLVGSGSGIRIDNSNNGEVRAISSSIPFLVGLSTGALEDPKFHDIIVDTLTNKYKWVWVKDQILKENLDYVDVYPDDDGFGYKLYENRDQYINFMINGGNTEYFYMVEYISRQFASGHISGMADIHYLLKNNNDYSNSLLVCDSGTSLMDVLLTVGGRNVRYLNKSGNYYSLEPVIGESKSDFGTIQKTFTIYMTPENRAFAFLLPGLLDYEGNGFSVENLEKFLRKKYPEASDSDIFYPFMECSVDSDLVLDAGENLIKIGQIPHAMGDPYLLIANKKELNKFNQVFKNNKKEDEVEKERNRLKGDELKKALDDL